MATDAPLPGEDAAQRACRVYLSRYRVPTGGAAALITSAQLVAALRDAFLFGYGAGLADRPPCPGDAGADTVQPM